MDRRLCARRGGLRRGVAALALAALGATASAAPTEAGAAPRPLRLAAPAGVPLAVIVAGIGWRHRRRRTAALPVQADELARHVFFQTPAPRA